MDGVTYDNVSVFSGAGGLDVGLERSGFATVVATDLDPVATAVLEASRAARLPVRGQPGRTHLATARILNADVATLTAADLRPPGAPARWRPALLSGGPPCQPFSSAGHERALSDPRGRLFEHMVRLAAELRPRLVLLENVRGLASARDLDGERGGVLSLIQASFAEIGYETTWGLVDAADHDAGQSRIRLFLIAADGAEPPALPTAAHGRRRSLGDVLATLEPPTAAEIVHPSGKHAAALLALEPGDGVRSPGKVENERPGGHWGYRQGYYLADLARPARTVLASGTTDWVRIDGETRRLTRRELAALQGFPAGWALPSGTTAHARLVGNAVQADAAEAVGRVLRAWLAEQGLSAAA